VLDQVKTFQTGMLNLMGVFFIVRHKCVTHTLSDIHSFIHSFIQYSV